MVIRIRPGEKVYDPREDRDMVAPPVDARKFTAPMKRATKRGQGVKQYPDMLVTTLPEPAPEPMTTPPPATDDES